MKSLTNKIDEYLNVIEEKERINLTTNISSDLNKILEFVKNSKNKEKAISMFNEGIQKEVRKLMEGGIL